MILVDDNSEPDLVGIIENKDDFVHIRKMVDGINRDLVDSGFDKYQYKAERKGKKAYIRLK
tara:strand:- start:1411 stop:1593 length:183 start_codon:yes stop_codon:yes gene_type:complete